jgi:hypothetical protein
MTFGSNGVDQVSSLQKISTQFRLANLCVNGTCSASFAMTSETVRNAPKHEFWVQWSGSSAVFVKSSYTTSFRKLMH